jgi:hypothetical protein
MDTFRARPLRQDEVAGFETSFENLKTVCREGRAAEVPVAAAALMRYQVWVDTCQLVVEAVSANQMDVVVALFQVLFARAIMPDCCNAPLVGFVDTVAQEAARAGHAGLLQWALRAVPGREWRGRPSKILGSTGRLDLLCLLESSDDTASAVSHKQALEGACHGRQVAVIQWALDCFEQKLRATGKVRTLWTAVEAMRYGTGTAEVDGAIWQMLVAYAAGAGLPHTYYMMDAFRLMCEGNKLTLAQLIFEHSQATPVWNLHRVCDRRMTRICSKYAPDVACWLYTLDPTFAEWQVSAKARVELLIADRKVSLLRLAWVAAVVRMGNGNGNGR